MLVKKYLIGDDLFMEFMIHSWIIHDQKSVVQWKESRKNFIFQLATKGYALD